MAHAWLDSLSEDWVSQPGSETSQLELPNLSKATTNKLSPSRIPRLNSTGNKPKHQQRPNSATLERSGIALGERSLSEINIPVSQRTPTKSPRESKASQRRHPSGRSLSASSSGSILHNTVEQRPHSATNNLEDVPEWKRRLVLGHLSYGESKDLFSSAATGLENIFRPPVSPDLSRVQDEEEEEEEEPEYIRYSQMTMPSSPPPYSGAMGSQRIRQLDNIPEGSIEESVTQQPAAPAPAPAPRQMKFRRTDESTDDGSRSENSVVEKTGAFTHNGTQERADSSFTSWSFRQRLDAASRKTSGQSIMKNEDFSPVLISRHNSEDGKVSFTPIEVPAQQLRKRLEHLRRNQLVLDSDPDSDAGPGIGPIAEESGHFENTEDFATKGGFLNLRRGGRSTDGSFRDRPLSPPTAMPTDTSEMLPESSIQASTPKQLPTIRTERFVSTENQFRPISPPSPALPRAPHPSPEKQIRPPQSSGGSPLKLFGPYDTFTNQTLLRRISQFEDQMTRSPSRSVGDESSFHFHQASDEASPAFGKFGAGELDGYEFSEDITLASAERSELEDKENLAPEGERRPSTAVQFDIGDPSSDGESLFIRRQRHKSSIAGSPRQRRHVTKASFDLRLRNSLPYVRGLQATPKRDSSEGKRPWTSPSKDPTPKRRRTLHRSDIAYGQDDGSGTLDSLKSLHDNMQSAFGRRRKGSLQQEMRQMTIPDIPVSRSVSRPRSPTPSSQKLADAQQRKPLTDIEFSASDTSAGAMSLEESDFLAQDLDADGSRKTSMKTQDFYNAAEEIMAMIRNKARPKMSLENVEESDGESSDGRHMTDSGAMEEESFQESTREPLSRPPSREGAPLLRVPNRQENPEIIDRLKQYEEVSELGYLTGSLRQWKETDQSAPSFDESFQDQFDNNQLPPMVSDETEVTSDLSHVRLTRNLDGQESGSGDSAPESNGSQGSRGSGTITGHSIPTISSSRSDSRRLIAPDAVTELIGDQVGNMVFDKEKKVWVKVKTSSKPASSARNILPSEDSEDDPFASIPDLSVDTLKEKAHLGFTPGPKLQNIEEMSREDSSSGSSKEPNATEASLDSPSPSPSLLSHTKETFARLKQTLVDTPLEDDEEIEHEISIHEDRMHESTSTRRRNLTISFSSPIASFIHDVTLPTEGDASDEESILPNQSVDTTSGESFNRGRYGTPSRSVSRRLSQSRSRSRSKSRSKGPAKNLAVKGESFVPRPVSRIDEQDEDSTVGELSTLERQVSIRADSSMVGPETDNEHHDSFSVVLTTPGPVRLPALDATPVIAQYVGTLSLSPLSEFTMHHGDQSCALEVSYVVGDQHLVTGGHHHPNKKVMSKALRSLVEKITEVEPFEPDWDAMRELDIHGKQLTTLHKLDEFCTGVVTLDASHNALGHLDGVPEGVRNLRLTHNLLSELTAWGHLRNLQYVDVSHNQLRSLAAFADLVHLRSLRADHNQIAHLDGGILRHDGLQVLRVRHNRLGGTVDFGGARLHRLTELDLEGNRIGAVRGLEQLPCLATLNLQRNALTEFEESSSPSLRYLKLSDNDLGPALDLAPFPQLRLLHADRNQLTTLTGFARCRRLDTLSLREQQQQQRRAMISSSFLGEGEGEGEREKEEEAATDEDENDEIGETTTVAVPLDISFLAHAYEVRKLFLSGNTFASASASSASGSETTFDLPVDYLNLQYLELANCGLRALAPGLGERCPNLRVCNLNCNALADLGPLRYVPRLKRLLVAANRLADARRFTQTLRGFPHLARLDARDNPATLGFYPPPSVSSTSMTTAVTNGEEQFTLPDVVEARRDRMFQARLDMGTRMRRRLYEVVVLGRCRRLKTLDGLPVERGAGGGPLALVRRDHVWEALVASGVVSAAAPGEEGGVGVGEGGKEAGVEEEEEAH